MSAGEIDILLVEDSSTDVDLTLHVLRQSTLANRTCVARDGEEALEYLFGRGAYSDRGPKCPVKLILLDLKLPKVDGLTVLRAIKNGLHTKVIPVVILTSSREEKDVMNCYDLGANSYVQKRSRQNSGGGPDEWIRGRNRSGAEASVACPVCRRYANRCEVVRAGTEESRFRGYRRCRPNLRSVS